MINKDSESVDYYYYKKDHHSIYFRPLFKTTFYKDLKKKLLYSSKDLKTIFNNLSLDEITRTIIKRGKIHYKSGFKKNINDEIIDKKIDSCLTLVCTRDNLPFTEESIRSIIKTKKINILKKKLPELLENIIDYQIVFPTYEYKMIPLNDKEFISIRSIIKKYIDSTVNNKKSKNYTLKIPKHKYMDVITAIFKKVRK